MENSAAEKKEGEEGEQETGRTKRGNDKKIYILYLEREPELKTKHIIKSKINETEKQRKNKKIIRLLETEKKVKTRKQLCVWREILERGEEGKGKMKYRNRGFIEKREDLAIYLVIDEGKRRKKETERCKEETVRCQAGKVDEEELYRDKRTQMDAVHGGRET